MKQKIYKSIIVLCIALFINTTIISGNAYAQQDQQRSKAIPEDDRPSAAGPWLVGIILSAGAIVVGLKNSKRTHLD